MSAAMIGRLARFGGVGIAATLVHVLTALALERWASLSDQAANLGGFLVAVVVSYFGHSRITFGVDPRSAGQFLRFFTVALSGLAASSLIVWLATTRLGYGFPVAMGLVALIVPLITFAASQIWVFRERPAADGTAWQGAALAAAIPLALALLSWGRPLTDDVAWYLIATRDWLAGAELYLDIIEVNPPLNFYYTVPAILISDGFGLGATNGQYVLTSMLILLSLLWCNAIIRQEMALTPNRQLLLLAGIGVAMTVPALDSIGQREQTMVILMMPWLIGHLATVPARPRSEVTRALVAALGMCVKPHFVMFPIAVTVLRMAQRRSLWPILSPANLTFLATGLAYVAYVALVHPAYLTEITPIARQIYGAYQVEVALLITAAYPKVLILAFPCLMALRDRPNGTNPAVFVAAALAGLACYLVQGTGFAYHLIPLTAFGMTASLIVILQLRSLGPLAAACAVAFAGLAVMGLKQGYPRHSAVVSLNSVADRVGPFDSFIALSSSLFAGPPVALATNAEWVSRYPAMWLVPGAVSGLSRTDCQAEPDSCATYRAIAARNRSDTVADMTRTPPDLLIIDRNSGYFPTAGFDWLAFMAEDPAWAPIFAQYDEVAATRRFLYFRRQPE